MDWSFDTITMFALSVALSIIGLSMSLFAGDQYALIVLFAAGGSVSVGGGFFKRGDLLLISWMITQRR
jgi:hypothetical protein